MARFPRTVTARGSAVGAVRILGSPTCYRVFAETLDMSTARGCFDFSLSKANRLYAHEEIIQGQRN